MEAFSLSQSGTPLTPKEQPVRREAVSICSMEGPLAPPMANGELAFAEPWQGRIFGMAWALCEGGCFEWREFQASLIEAIAHHDGSQEAAQDQEYAYYDRFQEALEALLVAKGLASGAGLETRRKALAERPHGHDH